MNYEIMILLFDTLRAYNTHTSRRRVGLTAGAAGKSKVGDEATVSQGHFM